LIKTIREIGIAFIVLISVFTSLNSTMQAEEPTIIWSATLYGNESGGISDYVEFGEAANATDGPPGDIYDVAQPPPPMAPYLQIWLNDNIPTPYNMLWNDYRHYPGTRKIWNLTIQWMPRNYISSTNVTIEWDPTVLGISEYTSITLYTLAGTPLKHMLLNNNYSFLCPANVPQHFTIIGERTNLPPATPENPTGDINGYHGTSHNYSTTTTDPNGNNLYYRFDWGTSTMSDWLGPYQSGIPISTEYTWEAPGTYLVKVKARDTIGKESNWSQPLSVNMTNRAPDEPSLPSPQNGATQVQIHPTLHWSSNDLDGDIVTYDIYFGLNTSPSRIISGQSDTSFSPNALQYQTTYYWRIVAKDTFNANTTSMLWSFQTVASDGGNPGTNGPTDEQNLPPVANGSASEKSGLVGALLMFNGSLSFDPDGYLTNWSWEYGDGTTGTGEKTSHNYLIAGRYTVTLTVTDNDDVTDNDSFMVFITTANYPPTQPAIEGTTHGNKNTLYAYTVRSTDADNDFIQYRINWGDATQNTSDFLPNGTAYSFQHSWSSPGKYNVLVTTSDNSTISGQTTCVVFIDVHFMDTSGFLYDMNNDAVFDSFFSNSTSIVTPVEKLENGGYIFTIDGENGRYYIYDPITGTFHIKEQKESSANILWIVLFVIIVAIAVIMLLILYKKRSR
jgi:chitodextrinase